MKKLLVILCGLAFGSCIRVNAMLTEDQKAQKEALIKWMRGAPIEEIHSIKTYYAHLFQNDPLPTTCSDDNEVSELNENND